MISSSMINKKVEEEKKSDGFSGRSGWTDLYQLCESLINPKGSYAYGPPPTSEEMIHLTTYTQPFRGILFDSSDRDRDDQGRRIDPSEATSLRLHSGLLAKDKGELRERGKYEYAETCVPISGFCSNNGRTIAIPTEQIMGTDQEYFGPGNKELAKRQGGSWLEGYYYKLSEIALEDSSSDEEDGDGAGSVSPTRRKAERILNLTFTLAIPSKAAREAKANRARMAREQTRISLRRNASTSSQNHLLSPSTPATPGSSTSPDPHNRTRARSISSILHSPHLR